MQDPGLHVYSSGQSGSWRHPLGYGVGQDCWYLPSQPGILHLHCWHHNLNNMLAIKVASIETGMWEYWEIGFLQTNR